MVIFYGVLYFWLIIILELLFTKFGLQFRNFNNGVFSITAVHEEECRPELEEKKPASDHPLSLLKESKWKNSFDDRDLWNLIEKDMVRTKPKCNFFQEEYEL